MCAWGPGLQSILLDHLCRWPLVVDVRWRQVLTVTLAVRSSAALFHLWLQRTAAVRYTELRYEWRTVDTDRGAGGSALKAYEQIRKVRQRKDADRCGHV